MQEERKETQYRNYLVEREYLARINITELISSLIQSHSFQISEKEEGAD